MCLFLCFNKIRQWADHVFLICYKAVLVAHKIGQCFISFIIIKFFFPIFSHIYLFVCLIFEYWFWLLRIDLGAPLDMGACAMQEWFLECWEKKCVFLVFGICFCVWIYVLFVCALSHCSFFSFLSISSIKERK